MNYLTYPMKVLNITQSYTGTFSHSNNYLGSPNDYPIDDNGGSTSQDSYFYCPCDEMIVKKVYGVGNSGTNTIWLESTSKVNTPMFNDYVTILVMHCEDNDLRNLYVGRKYTRGEIISLEGKDGYATGYHYHLVTGKGQFSGSGWQKNSKGTWVINTTGGASKPEDTFYIDKSFTRVMNTEDIDFKYLPEDEVLVPEENVTIPEYENKIGYVTAYSLNVRKGPGIENTKFNTLPGGTKIIIEDESNGWYKIGVDQWVSGDYVTFDEPSTIYETKEVTAYWLNVRKTANGTKLKTNAPIPMYTKVAVMKSSGGWVQINSNRWVYDYYLK